MASIHLQGILRDSLGEIDVGAIITFTHMTTTGETISSTKRNLLIPPNGAYSIDVEYGQIRIDYTTRYTERFVSMVIVNQDSTATSLPELLNAAVPVTPAVILEMQGILADAVAASDTSEAFANQLTTFDLIGSAAVFAPDTNITTKGYLTSGDGGSGSWVQNGMTGQTPSQSPAQLGDALLNDGNGNQWDLVGLPIDVRSLGAQGKPFDDALPIAALIARLKSNGGGAFHVGEAFNCAEIVLDFSDVAIVSNGGGELTLNNGVNNNVISIVNASNVIISGLKIDQNRLNQTAGHGIRLDNSKNVWLTNLDIINAVGYGIGLQGFGTHENVYIDNVTIDGVQADGIDIKNRQDNNKNIFISNVNISSFNIDSDNKAGIDVRGLVNLSNINVDVSQGVTPTAIRFRAGELLDENGIGAHKSTLTNFQITQQGSTVSVGVNLGARHVKVSNGTVVGLSQGVAITGEDCKVSGVDCIENSLGFNLIGDRARLVNCTAKDNTSRGFDVSGNNVNLTSCDSVNNVNHGIRTQGSATGCTINSGLVSGNSPNIGDGGINTIVVNVDGFVSESYVETIDLLVDSVGVKPFQTAHGLTGAPSIQSVILSLQAVTAVDDYELSYMRVDATSGGNIEGRIFVSSASATAGAVVKVNIHSKRNHQ